MLFAREFTRLLEAELGMKMLVGMAEGSFFASLGLRSRAPASRCTPGKPARSSNKTRATPDGLMTGIPESYHKASLFIRRRHQMSRYHDRFVLPQNVQLPDSAPS